MNIEEKLNNIKNFLSNLYIERNEQILALIIATLASQNLLLLGPPGVGKSALVRTWSKCIKGAKYFERLVSQFSVPEELFGPLSLTGLKEDKFIRKTTGYLPEAHFAFLDEIFKSSSSLLNTLLTALNERIFYNDCYGNSIPLFTLIGASNEVPETEDRLDQLYDRFHLKLKVSSITEVSGFIKMIETDYNQSIDETLILSLEEIKDAQDRSQQVLFPKDLIELLAKIRSLYLNDGFIVSDRQWKQSIKTIKGKAFLRGSTIVKEEDFEILQHMLWYDPNQEYKSTKLLLSIINPDKNEALEILENALDAISQTEKIKDKNDRLKELLVVAKKIKEGKNKIDEIIKERTRHGKHTEELEIIYEKLNKLITAGIFKSIGMDFGSTVNTRIVESLQ